MGQDPLVAWIRHDPVRLRLMSCEMNSPISLAIYRVNLSYVNYLPLVTASRRLNPDPSAYAVVGSRVLLNIKDMLETATIIGLGTADETPPSEPIAFRAAPNATTLSDRMGDGISVGD